MELMTLAIVSYSLGMALLSEWVSLSYGFGALLAGLIWGRIGVDQVLMTRAEEVVQTLSSLFGSIYSASLGMIVSPEFIYHHWSKIAIYVIFVALVKTTAATCTLRGRGFALPAAIAGGTSLAHLSTIALFFTGRAEAMGLLSRELHLTTLSAAFVMLALAPLPTMLMKRVPAKLFMHVPRPPTSSCPACCTTDPWWCAMFSIAKQERETR